MLFNEPSPLETKVLTRRFGLPNSASLDTYLATEGYQAFLKAAKMKPEEIIAEMKVSNLRGRGGAGFPTGMKWGFVPRTSSKPKYIVVNGDESEPGTCKDRVLIENDPHQLIEGVLIAGLSVDAHAGYIYIRGEYRYLIEVMEKALAEAYEKGWLGKNIQGTAFAALGITKSGGTKMTCLTGHINKPGVYELKLGFPVKQMIEEVGGGIRNGKKLKAFIPGGSSCPVLTAAEVEGATMDYDSMASRKTMLGSGGVIIMDEDTCM